MAIFVVAGLRLIIWAMGTDSVHADVVIGPQVFEWRVDNPAFGGISALLMDAGGSVLLAGGDRGTLVQAHVRRDEMGRIAAVEDTRLTPVSLASGLAPTTFKRDLEALARDSNGVLFMAFEGFVRIERLAWPGARPEPTHPWDHFASLFGNQAFEALASLPDDRLIAIAETPKASGLADSVIHDGTRWHGGPDIPTGNGFAITGADVGPDGCLYLVERRYRLLSGFIFRVRRLSGGPCTRSDTVLYTSAPADIGNAEAVATWHDDQGRIVLDLITDNGFLPFTMTRLIELRAKATERCKLAF